MVLPAVFLIHSAILNSRRRNYMLGYDNGTAVFTAGQILTGATSDATAIIVSTGSAGSGSLILHTITGTFQDDEAISDDGTVPGAAVVNGTIADALDQYGEITYTTLTSTVACRFISPAESFRNNKGAAMIVSTPRVLFPAGTNVAEKDTVTSTEEGFARTFTVGPMRTVYEAAQKIISHISCDIAAVS